jgi:transposase-like protein
LRKKESLEEGKMSPVKYYTIMRRSKDPRGIRHEMVRYAKEEGVKPAARVFSTTPKTVRKWLRRWRPGSVGAWKTKVKLLRARGLESIQIKDKRLLN